MAEIEDRIISDHSKRLMQKIEWNAGGNRYDGYGLGLAISEVDSRFVYGHSGGIAGFASYTIFDPQERFAISVLTNTTDAPASEIIQGLLKLVDLAASQKDGTSEKASTKNLAKYCGRFYSLWQPVDIVLLGSRLFAFEPTSSIPSGTSVLHLETESRLKIETELGTGFPGEYIDYHFAADGSVEKISFGGLTCWASKAVAQKELAVAIEN
jgi:hypothetical protein